MDQFFSALSLSVAAMFPIINPIGHATMFYMMTQDDSAEFRHRQARKASFYTFLILLFSLVFGSYLLRFFGISLNDLRIAGGLLVARAAWSMLGNTSRMTPAERDAASDKEDISLTPMATPILSGPGAMSLAIGMITYGSTPLAYAGYISGFLIIALLTWVCLRYSDMLVRIISVNGVGALNRMLGFLILAIGVNLMIEGVKNTFFPHV